MDTRRIEEVRRKDVLTEQDMETIDQFVADAVSRLVRTLDFTEVAKTRALILNNQSTQAQYAAQYSESTYTHIVAGMEEAKANIPDKARLVSVLTNLLILVDGLKAPGLVDVAVGEIDNESSAVRYWAVRAATDPELWTRIGQGQGDTTQLVSRILTACSLQVDRSSPEVLHRMAEFAGRHDTSEALGLLARTAGARISQYADWTVKHELTDAAILKIICDKLSTGDAARAQLAAPFAQLLSFVMQRYIRGQRHGVLTDVSTSHLASVMLEVSQSCLGTLLGTPQTMILRAIEAGDIGVEALQTEHDRLLGGPDQAGVLPSKLGFTYSDGGEDRSIPLVLPDPPSVQAVVPAGPQP
jgi:hypothetical protein